eukprot:6638229-Prymnesium_polylepis.2
MPGLTFGTLSLTTSRTDGRWLMHSASQGGGNIVRPHGMIGGGFAQREQSLPTVSGHGRHAPELQLPAATQLSTCSPTLQPQSKSAGW